MTDNVPTQLGPNDVVQTMAGDKEKPYEPVKWPAWRYHPETGKGQVFQSPEEVPEGWGDLPPGATPAGEAPVFVDTSRLEDGTPTNEGAATNDGSDDGGEETPLDKDGLVALGQAKLAEILQAKNDALKAEEKEEIEFLPNWPKVKLADAILANGGYSVPKEV